MTLPPEGKQPSRGHCLSDMDLYRYLARTPGDRSLADLEAHVSTCPHCLEALAELIKLLHPESGHVVQPAQETSHKANSRNQEQIPFRTASKNRQVLNTLPDEEFFSRDIEIQELFHCGLDVRRAMTPNQFLSGPRKSGKTEILKRVYNRLFLEQSQVIPFFHSVPQSLPSAEVFCREYFLDSILQLLAFLKQDPQLVAAPELSPDTVLRLAYESRYPWLVELVNHFHSSLRKSDLHTLTRLALHFAATAAVRSGLCAFVIVDDFHHVASLRSDEELAQLTGVFLTALQSRQAPHLLSIPSTVVLEGFSKTIEIHGNAEVYSLKPLDSIGACRLLEGLCERFDVALESNLSLSIVDQMEHQPFYIRAIVQGARRDQVHLDSLRKFAEVYVAELTQGSLHVYFSGRFNSARLNSPEKIKALELLHTSFHLDLDSSTLEHFRPGPVGEGCDAVRILDALGEAHLIERALGTARPIEDRVLRDWIEWNIQHTLRGHPRDQATYRTTVRLLKQLHESLQLRRESDRLECLERMLDHMNCQSVPCGLLDFDQLGAMEIIKEPQKLSSFLDSQKQIQLPEILALNRQRIKPSGARGHPWTLLTASGFEDGDYADGMDTAWVAAYRIGHDPVGLNEIQDFFNQCQRLVRENHLERARFWMVAETRFNQAAMSFAHTHGIMTSSSLQFALLESRILPAPTKAKEERVLPANLATYELTIPCTPDAELVAVKAMEQLSELIDFEEKAKGQIRMAIMEACLNAKESAISPEARIRLQFQAGMDCLVAQVRVELPESKEHTPGKVSAKTWNLKLLQSLMDEVRVVPFQQGWELVMIKHLRTEMPMAGAG